MSTYKLQIEMTVTDSYRASEGEVSKDNISDFLKRQSSLHTMVVGERLALKDWQGDVCGYATLEAEE